jgi:hypothetical protein
MRTDAEDFMRFVVFLIAALALSAAHGAGLPFAVESLQKAQSIAKQDARHVLVFYTSEY